jgi:hypothetical protein
VDGERDCVPREQFLFKEVLVSSSMLAAGLTKRGAANLQIDALREVKQYNID